jgi:uncharacterized protein DUF4303
VDGSAGGFDWARFEDALTDGLVSAVRAAIASDPGERFDAAALGHIYCETDGVISLPLLSIDTVSALAERGEADDGTAWNPADWEHVDDDWLPGGEGRGWLQALTAHACRGSRADWNAAYGEYLATLVRACLRGRAVLRGQQDDFLVVLIDEDRPEELIRATLTAEEVRRHFPSFERRAAEAARVCALTPAGQAAYHVGQLGDPRTSEQAEQSLRALGQAAVPALLPLLASPGSAWQAAKILADIGHADDAVTSALAGALTRHQGPDQWWIACALSRLGHGHLVLAKAADLSDDVVAGAIAAPYTSFRDHATHPLPLDYQPLADSLEHRAQYAPALSEQLRPGRGKCAIRLSEVDEALRGLTSPHVLIRSHAACVLGDRDLGPAAAPLILPRLATAAREDPDADVRRLAILSLQEWSNDAHPYANIIRDARDLDPHPKVRDTATHCLLQAAARESGTL